VLGPVKLGVGLDFVADQRGHRCDDGYQNDGTDDPPSTLSRSSSRPIGNNGVPLDVHVVQGQRVSALFLSASKEMVARWRGEWWSGRMQIRQFTEN
jgi:hypothetical protein